MDRSSLHKQAHGICFLRENETERAPGSAAKERAPEAERQASISLWAPFARKAALLLTEKKLQLPLKETQYGYWELITDKITPGDRYRFLLDGEKELPDPASLSQPEGVHGPSEALDIHGFQWTDTAWKNHDLNDYLLYELHTGTFTREGTFEGIEKKLDHLLELGINTIELMPVAQFPGCRNWGYDGVFPYAVQHSYGGARGLQHLVNRCHEKGLAVVLDVVYNHLGPEGNYLRQSGPYFTGKYPTPWGEAVNFDDAWCDGVRRYFIDNALMWFRDFHMDGLRLDAVHAIKDFSPVHLLREIKEHTLLLEERTGRRHHLIVECDLNDTRFINPVNENGYGMDAQWLDEFHHALRVTAGQERQGYYADFNGIGHLAKAYRRAYVYDGIYSPHRHRTFGTDAGSNPGRQFIVFSQNHDQVGNRMLGERTSRLVSFEMQKLLAGAVMAAPFLPLLFMGEEWSEPNPFLYFINHSDPALVEAVRRGRQSEFAAFQSRGKIPDPQAEETFRSSTVQWELLKREPHQTMFRYYQAVIALRKQHPVLRRPHREGLETAVQPEERILALRRWNGGSEVLCLMNFSREQQPITLPGEGVFPISETTWKKLLDSAAPEWKGPAAASDTVKTGTTIHLQPESIIIYGNKESST